MTTYFDFLQILAVYWLGAYVTLAGLYLIVGKIVVWYNKTQLKHRRIQEKECPNEQIQRDVRQSLKSLINISCMLALGLSLRKMGFSVPVFELSWLSMGIGAVASLLLFDTWFYWAHRAIHHPRLYKKIHRWHHRAITPTVWSNNSDTFLDNLFCQSYWFFAPLVLPVPTAILIAHKIYDQITGILGHAGYEYAPGAFSAKPSPMIGTTFHDLHHSKFHYNFATHFSHWDRLMGTLHPEYDKQVSQYAK